jgi:hypothetical protein
MRRLGYAETPPSGAILASPATDCISDIFCQWLFHSVSACDTMPAVGLQKASIIKHSGFKQGREVGI